MKQIALSYPAANGRTRHTADTLLSDGDAKAIVQIVCDRVSADDCGHLARFLADAGCITLLHVLPLRRADGASYDDFFTGADHPAHLITDDIHALRTQAQTEFSALPYFMLGYGVCSYFLRAYLTAHGDGLHGVLPVGTGYVAPGAGSLRLYGDKLRSAFGGAGARLDLAGKYALTHAKVFSCNETHIQALPKNLAVFLLSGAEDPGGNRGAGVRRVQEKMLAAGMTDISCKLYPGVGADLFADHIRATFFADVSDFLRAHMDDAHRSSYDSNKAYAEKKAAEQKDYEIDQILI